MMKRSCEHKIVISKLSAHIAEEEENVFKQAAEGGKRRDKESLSDMESWREFVSERAHVPTWPIASGQIVKYAVANLPAIFGLIIGLGSKST
jgi:hypothetical protein